MINTCQTSSKRGCETDPPDTEFWTPSDQTPHEENLKHQVFSRFILSDTDIPGTRRDAQSLSTLLSCITSQYQALNEHKARISHQLKHQQVILNEISQLEASLHEELQRLGELIVPGDYSESQIALRRSLRETRNRAAETTARKQYLLAVYQSLPEALQRTGEQLEALLDRYHHQILSLEKTASGELEAATRGLRSEWLELMAITEQHQGDLIVSQIKNTDDARPGNRQKQ